MPNDNVSGYESPTAFELHKVSTQLKVSRRMKAFPGNYPVKIRAHIVGEEWAIVRDKQEIRQPQEKQLEHVVEIVPLR